MLPSMLIINMKRVISLTVKLTALLELIMSITGSLHSLVLQIRKLPFSGLVMIARPERAKFDI